MQSCEKMAKDLLEENEDCVDEVVHSSQMQRSTLYL